MEGFAAVLVPVLVGAGVFRLIWLPMKWGLRMVLHMGSGLVCLWLLGTVSGFTGIQIPVNALTAAVAGFLGLPGVSLLALLELL